MGLRQEIEQKIAEANGDPEKAAIAVCLLLEDELDLSGNGWFDEDHEFQEILLELE